MDLTSRFLMNGNNIWVAVLHWQTKPCRKTKKEDCTGQDGDEECVGKLRHLDPEAVFSCIPTREQVVGLTGYRFL